MCKGQLKASVLQYACSTRVLPEPETPVIVLF
jgi:hypothetical protein